MSSGQSNPTVGEVHIDAALTNFMVKLMDGEDFVVNQVWPVVRVKKENDFFYVKTDRRHLHPRGPDTFRAPGMVAQNFDYELTQGAYECVEHALKRPVADRIRDNADEAVLPGLDAVEEMCRAINLKFEMEFHGAAFTIANYPAAHIIIAAAPWCNTVTSNPETDIDAAKLAVMTGSGVWPNTIIIPEHIYRCLKQHPLIVQFMVAHAGAMNYLQTGKLPQFLFGLKVIVPGSLYDASGNPCQDADISMIFNDDAVVVCYVEPNPGLETATYGVQFRHIRNGIGPCRVRTWRDEPAEATVKEASVLNHPMVTNQAGSAIIAGLGTTGTS